MELLKKCCRCKVEKSLTEFCKNKATKEGLHWEFDTCKTELYYLNKESLFPKLSCPIEEEKQLNICLLRVF
jgi:hypothetical protein